jgi:hypothetical protein
MMPTANDRAETTTEWSVCAPQLLNRGAGRLVRDGVNTPTLRPYRVNIAKSFATGDFAITFGGGTRAWSTADAAPRNLRPIMDHTALIGFRVTRTVRLGHGSKSALQKFLGGPKMNIWRRELPAEPSQVVRGGQIARATAGEYGIAAVVWLVFAGLIIAAWVFLLDACWLTVPARWGANFCPRPVDQDGLVAEELRNRELAALLASIKSDLTNRTPCPTL